MISIHQRISPKGRDGTLARGGVTGMKLCPICKLPYPPDAVNCFVHRVALVAAPDPCIGKIIAGKYRIESVVGAGGMATVYRAQFIHQDRPVAVKVFRRELSGDHKLRERFRREATSTRRLVHPNIIEILDQGDMDDGTPFLVMEFLEGQNLEIVLKKHGGPLPLPRVIDLMLQVVSGLARAHDFQVIHRDLKPDNLFVCASPDGEELVKILDFGIARFMLDSRLTGTGEIFGTPQYMAPERITTIEAGPSADLYALGCIMFRCCTGRLPFAATDVTAFLIQHLKERPPSPRAFNPEVPVELDGLILQCLEKSPTQRPVDAHAIGRSLAALAARFPRARRNSGLYIAPTPPARSILEKATVAGGMFTSAAIERWVRRVELLSNMLDRAFPTGAQPLFNAALGRLRATVTAMVDVHSRWVQDQSRADALAERGKEAQQRFNRAMEALGKDLSAAREAHRMGVDLTRQHEEHARPRIEPFTSLHAEIVATGAIPNMAPSELVQKYRAALAALESAWPFAEELRRAQQYATAREGEVKDLEFQIEALRAQSDRLAQTSDDELRTVQQRLESAANQLAEMESALIRDASGLTASLRGRRDLDDLFAAFEADAA
jgi:serine/threonine-protein kinase